MNYIKKGILFTFKDLKLNYIKSHAMVPSPLKIGEGVYRIYFTSRNKKNQSFESEGERRGRKTSEAIAQWHEERKK